IASPQLIESIEMTSAPVAAGFSGLYERHYEAVFRTALRVTGRPADAEDVLQTVFGRLLSGSEHDEAARRPAAYFRRAAVNAAVDLLRRPLLGLAAMIWPHDPVELQAYWNAGGMSHAFWYAAAAAF